MALLSDEMGENANSKTTDANRKRSDKNHTASCRRCLDIGDDARTMNDFALLRRALQFVALKVERKQVRVSFSDIER